MPPAKHKVVPVTFGKPPAAFDWMTTRPVTRPDARKRAYRVEIEDRAALLYRLRYSQEQTRVRVRANARWDFEVGAAHAPLSHDEIDAIVAAVYKRGDAHSGAPSV